ncbi:hypothetical protein LO772_25810 [Yinghuangia sp. ASG 101]|uniref:hypothetical protein n=1 Tax=Yinghuangia sp. ASG 101 TaxID=2896848 RepID=UPI001E4669D7|nr:hypothetical protein [Yinghuangia sp. ASG 101]UGQ10260.1 hypothetical protein LO772_25810 [Yinghuangia sp. ASG 101]
MAAEDASGAVLDRIVYRWQERDLLGARGLGPLAASLPPDRLAAWARELGPYVGMAVDVGKGPYTSVCWARTRLGPALIHREFALYGRENRPGNVAHALLDPGRLLGPHVVLALGVLDWAADGAGADEPDAGPPLPRMRADQLVALAQGRAATLRAAARDHGAVLARVAATLLARPGIGISLLRRDAGPDPVPLLWGVFDLMSHLVHGSWSFSTYETGDDASRPRFVVVPRWPAGDSPTRARIDTDETEGGGLFAEAARLLVECYTARPWAETREVLRALRSAAEFDPEPKARAILDALGGGRPGPVSLTRAERAEGGHARRRRSSDAAAQGRADVPAADRHAPAPPSAPRGPGGPVVPRESGNMAAPPPAPGVRGDGAVSPGRPTASARDEGTVVAPGWGGPPEPDERPGAAAAAAAGRPGPFPVDERAVPPQTAADEAVPPGACRPSAADEHAGAPRGDAAVSPTPPPSAARPPVPPPFVERPHGPAPPQPETRYLPVALPEPERPPEPESAAAAAPGLAARRPDATGPRHRSPSSGAAALAAAAAALDSPRRAASGAGAPGPGRPAAPAWSASTSPGASAGSGRHAKGPGPGPVPPEPPEPTARGWARDGWIEDGASDRSLRALVEAYHLLVYEGSAADGEFRTVIDQVDLVAAAVGLVRAEEALLPALVERLDTLVAPGDGRGARLPTPHEQAALERVLVSLNEPIRALDRCGPPRHRIASVVGRFAAYVLDGCQNGAVVPELAVVVRNLDTVSGTYRPYQQELVRAVVAHGHGARFHEEIGRLWAASRSLLPDPADPLEG